MKNSNMWLPRLRYHQNDNLLKCHVTTDCHDMCIAMDACIWRECKRMRERERVGKERADKRARDGGERERVRESSMAREAERIQLSERQREQNIVKLYMQMHHNFRNIDERRKIYSTHIRTSLWLAGFGEVSVQSCYWKSYILHEAIITYQSSRTKLNI